MPIVDIPLTGDEQIPDKSAPEYALSEFYRAFNGRNLALMAKNWTQSAQASMSNPLGGVKRGWDEIGALYKGIFNGRADVYVEFHAYTIHLAEDMFCAVGRERGHFRTGDSTIELAIRTSRIYRRQEGVWKQLHHHGSIDNPELLAEYQSAIRSVQ